MTPEDFKSWRKSMGLKRKETADLLGLKKRNIRNFENGKSKKGTLIPKSVTLACYALSRGVSQFDGKTATNSFNGLGAAAEDIVMVKSKKKPSKDKSGKAKKIPRDIHIIKQQ